jgi:hypothetical protein
MVLSCPVTETYQSSAMPHSLASSTSRIFFVPMYTKFHVMYPKLREAVRYRKQLTRTSIDSDVRLINISYLHVLAALKNYPYSTQAQ